MSVNGSTTATLQSSYGIEVHKHFAGFEVLDFVLRGCQTSMTSSSTGEGDAAKSPHPELVNLSVRSRYFAQLTDQVFGSQVCISLKHLHRFMPTDSRHLLIR